MGLDGLKDPLGRLGELVFATERQHRNLVRGNAVMQAQHGAQFTTHLLFVIGRQQERHHGPGGSGSRLDHMGHIAGVGSLVEVLQLLAGMLGVLGEVKVTAVGHTFEFAPTPREGELHIGGGRRVVRQLVGVVGTHAQH